MRCSRNEAKERFVKYNSKLTGSENRAVVLPQPLLSLVLGTELDICIYGTTGHCRARDGTFALVAEAVD